MNAVSVRFGSLDERAALEDLQMRASIALPTYRAEILSHPEVIQLAPMLLSQRRVRVAESAGVPIGFAALLEPVEGLSELDGLFVEPACWRSGIGSKLLHDAYDMARSEGARSIHVVANPDAVEFYAKCGFVTVGETKTQFGPAPRMQYYLSEGR